MPSTFVYRREAGMCRICWSADDAADVGVTGTFGPALGVSPATAGKGTIAVSNKSSPLLPRDHAGAHPSTVVPRREKICREWDLGIIFVH